MTLDSDDLRRSFAIKTACGAASICNRIATGLRNRMNIERIADFLLVRFQNAMSGRQATPTWIRVNRVCDVRTKFAPLRLAAEYNCSVEMLHAHDGEDLRDALQTVGCSNQADLSAVRDAIVECMKGPGGFFENIALTVQIDATYYAVCPSQAR